MVGPSFSEDERERTSRRLKVGFVGLVGASAGLVALQVGSTLPQLVAVVAAGLAVGAVLTWFVARNLRELTPEDPRRRR